MQKTTTTNCRSFFYIFFLVYASVVSCNSPETNDRQKALDAYRQLSQEARLLPEHGAASFSTEAGVGVKLFAAEPMVVNPTNIAVDARGRVWVCESYNYAVPEEQREEAGGRIVILEDTNEDGVADIRKVFYQGEDVHLAIGIAVLGNRVYVTRSPDLLVFSDHDGDDVPDEKKRLFTGMGNPGDHSAHALVFGPDGNFYFNMGNMGKGVYDTLGLPVTDLSGNPVIQGGKDYLGGMVFRCRPDGSSFEVIAHNFRNNYEVAVDAYGSLWQSDNDDDGNQSCRINYLLEFGNYGYLDEMTRAGWTTVRTNMEAEIPERHWHQRDPGVVPNLLITGAGSPAGILCYEGDLLPAQFRGQVIHADAGPNVVRAYRPTARAAGYEASTEQVLHSELDQWFRPVDVAAAPDGSLFVADWYDPIVGGGAAGDRERGRIYRLAPKPDQYRLSGFEVEEPQAAVAALVNPNMDQQYQGWQRLHSLGLDARRHLEVLLNDREPRKQARALWLMGKIPGLEEEALNFSLAHENPDLRVVGVRLARQMGDGFPARMAALARDPSPRVRREIAVGLHRFTGPAAAGLWTELAVQHVGGDRWYLEALGIGAANQWDACLERWLATVGDDWNTDAGREIVWRSRASSTAALLAKLISASSTDSAQMLALFRSMDFQTTDEKNDLLTRLLETPHPHHDLLQALVLQHVDASTIRMTSSLAVALDRTLGRLKNTREYITLVRRFGLTDKRPELLNLITGSDQDLGVQAAQLLVEAPFDGAASIRGLLVGEPAVAGKVIRALAPLGGQVPVSLLSSTVMNPVVDVDVRKAAVLALGATWNGERELLSCVKQPAFDAALKPAAASVLFNVYRVSIQDEAARYLKRPGDAGGKQLPPIRTLLASGGDESKGEDVFNTYCQSCHVVGDRGVAFGPALSAIGDKLAKEGLYRAILYPSEGINYDYHGVTLELKDGSRVMGIVVSDTENYVELKMIGGVSSRYDAGDIVSRTPADASLMPNLATALTEEQLVDLVEYLTTLRND